MTKREFVEQFVIAYVRTGQSALNSTNMDMVVGIAESQWNKIEEMDKKDRGDHYG